MPRTLAQNAQYIAETIKPAIKSAIEAQGVTVPSTDSFLDYADRIAEIEGGGSGYQLKDLPTGSISTVNDAAELPLNALKVSVEAWQEGSGDPSPSNIRPIIGWDSGDIFVDSKNVIKQIVRGYVNSIGYITVDGDSESVLFYAKKGTTYTRSSQVAFNRNAIAQVDTGNITQTIPAYNITTLNQDTWLATWEGWTVWYCKASLDSTLESTAQIELGSTATTYEPYQGKQYTQHFPTTIYGAEWDVVGGELKQTDGYIASYNGETLPSTWISDRDVYASGTTPTMGAEVVYKLATPTTIPLSPLSIRMLQGVNNVYADCGDIIDGEYFIDEGAIDVRKVDYSIGSNSALKISDGRILQGFANMANYHSRPLGASGNWLDVDWSKDFEVCVAFKYTDSGASGITVLLGYNYDSSLNSRFRSPLIYIDKDHSRALCLEIGSNGSSWMVDQSLSYTIDLDTWYALKLKFTLSTLTLECSISTDFDTWTSLYNNTLSAAPYHSNTSMIGIGGGCQASAWSSNGLLVDTFNTYIKGDGVNWGASTGVFPS